MNSIV
jgi:hypothetical protein